jgi:outer membrane protein insertion porin family
VRKTYSLNIVEPYMFDKEFSGGASLFNTESDQQSYSSRKNGGSLSLGKSLGEYSNGNVSYRYNTVETYVDDLTQASLFVKSQIGIWQTSSLSATLSRDTRDDFFSPSKGYQTSFDATYAGGFLSGRNFYKLGLDSSYYKSLYFNVVFMGHGKIGYADSYGGEEFPIFENYFLGGSSSLRGFSFDDVGPLDHDGNSLGGNASLLFNIELQYPFTKFVRSFIFYDRGQVYGRIENLERTTNNMFDLEKMRHSWGFGIKFFSPIGPISLAWGFKLDPKPGEDGGEFHFDIGRAF